MWQTQMNKYLLFRIVSKVLSQKILWKKKDLLAMWSLLRQKRRMMEHCSAKAVITKLQERVTWINTSSWFIQQTALFINVLHLGASLKQRKKVTWNLTTQQSTREWGLIVAFALIRPLTRKVWEDTSRQDTQLAKQHPLHGRVICASLRVWMS